LLTLSCFRLIRPAEALVERAQAEKSPQGSRA
jgi:hypothetical protein